eukprot:TRINITY_DN8614_c0_g1_i2.p1 TRINITY_DN8614_c0_g1~~TRINITY_DN8614_c0_g1_i2.p1  ORF type:complete len:225 (-),score=76.09 TRINITY_DN8614_c0_g1_i2:14-688(-)
MDDYQMAVLESTREVLTQSGHLLLAANTFLKRSTDDVRTKWMELVSPLPRIIIDALAAFLSGARDGTVLSARPAHDSLTEMGKAISNVISEWSILEEKGSGTDVESIDEALALTEASLNCLENMFVETIRNAEEASATLEAPTNSNSSVEQANGVPVGPIQVEMQSGIEENQTFDTIDTKVEEEPNLTGVDKEIYELKKEVGHFYSINDPDKNILSALDALDDI